MALFSHLRGQFYEECSDLTTQRRHLMPVLYARWWSQRRLRTPQCRCRPSEVGGGAPAAKGHGEQDDVVEASVPVDGGAVDAA